MKSNLKLFVVALISFGIFLGSFDNGNSTNSNSQSTQTCSYLWAAQNSGTSSQLVSVYTVSNLVGWAAGVNGTVRRTIDGSFWMNANPNPGVIDGDIRNICALDENTALCTTSPSDANIYKTVNGGMNWTRVYNSFETAIFAIKMISATEGYALGSPHPVGQKWLILKTIDGGNSWSRIATEPSATNNLESGFRNSFQIMGNDMWFGTNQSSVYHSSDLGLTWSYSSTPGTQNNYAVHYNSGSMGLAGGDNPATNALVKTTDGGITYTSATAPTPGGTIIGLAGTGTDWWLIRTSVDILHSNDQGSTWTQAYTQSTGVFQDINLAIIDGCPQGWAVGNAGVMAKMAIVTGISGNNEIPDSYSLKQNFPNPFNPTTNISFSLPKAGLVSLRVYDMSGKEVKSLVNEVKNAGNYVIGFNASELSSGAYLYKIVSDNFVDTKKMLLIK